MKISEYDSSIQISDFENFLNVHEIDGNVVFNLNMTININVSEGSKLEYTLKTKAHWPLISYKIYGTTRLAWLLMKINKVKPSEVCKIKNAGDIIYYISDNSVQSILENIIS